MQNTAIDKLKQSLRGTVIQRSDPNYDEARALYNGMIDKKPLIIVRCADVADVIAVVNFSRESGLVVAIRGGAHNGPGLSSVNDGLVIDLSMMKGVRVDPAARTARVGAGCTQGDVDYATHAFGLAVPAGIVSTTGIAGLTLSGGHGYLSLKYGLTIDNLIEADVVLADGSFVTASNENNPDLLWALRRHQLPVPATPCQHRLCRSNRLGSKARPHDNAALSRVFAESAGGARDFPRAEDNTL
jgi:FAD/FMN-containing dehydrogenase